MNVLIAGGGTGGHLFPGIALAQELRRRFPESRVLFVGTARGIEVRAVPRAGFDLSLLPVSALRRVGIIQFVKGVLKLPWAAWEALRVVWTFRPDVSVSVGGYAAGPAIVASRLLGIPCVVMEQNAVMGFTNRLLSRIAKRVYAALPVCGVSEEALVLFGNPVRASFQKIREDDYRPRTPLRLLVFGGSQGAHALNQAMLDLLPHLKQEKVAISIVHQTGPNEYERVRQAYAQHPHIDSTVQPFIEKMADAYAGADLILCRSGATTIAEITVCGRPAILVPFPYAVDDHQTKNARALENLGGAVCVPQDKLSTKSLMALINDLANDPQRLTEMAISSRKAGHPEAALNIVSDLEKLCTQIKGAEHV